jgi:hypothetical protein
MSLNLLESEAIDECVILLRTWAGVLLRLHKYLAIREGHSPLTLHCDGLAGRLAVHVSPLDIGIGNKSLTRCSDECLLGTL